jgi:hypothetical protein
MDENPYRAPEDGGNTVPEFWPVIRRPWMWCLVSLITATISAMLTPAIARVPGFFHQTPEELVFNVLTLAALALAGVFAIVGAVRAVTRGRT